MSALPPFPTDESTLAMLELALNPGPEADRTSLGELLTLMSQMGGSDTEAVETTEVMPHPFVPGESVEAEVMRDPVYHENDVILALIAALRLARATEFTESAIRSACQNAIDRASHHLAQPNVPQSLHRYNAETNLAYLVLDLLRARAEAVSE